ncbi:MAG TPA: hypothetical protein VLY24_20085 [Bryobacteraceae bacterium]|nr:hypothetical protein [Bryobacteraceae bacterium]
MRVVRFLAVVLLCWAAVPAVYSQNASQYLLALPQIAYGGGWETKIVITNTNSGSVNLTINYYDTNGNPLMVPFSGVPTSQSNVLVPANGQLEVVPDFQGTTTVVGWAGFTPPGEIGLKIQGVFLWQNQGNSTQAVAPTVSLSAPCIIPLPNPTLVTMPFDMTNGGLSAYAFANTMPTPVTMTLTFYDQNGNQIGTYQPAAIPAYGHTQFGLNTIGVAALAGAKGSMQISGAGVVPLGFKFYGSIFTTWLP